MSVTLQKTLPRFKIIMDLKETLKTYTNSNKKSTFVEGSLSTGVFARTVDVTINARTQDIGIQRFTFEGRDTYSLPVNLDSEDLKVFEDLCKRVVEFGEAQTVGDDDQWEFLSPVKDNKTWYIKVRVKNGEFVPVINGGEVTMGKPSPAKVGDKVKIVGKFGVWMNPKLGQYGIKFDAKTIDY